MSTGGFSKINEDAIYSVIISSRRRCVRNPYERQRSAQALIPSDTDYRTSVFRASVMYDLLQVSSHQWVIFHTKQPFGRTLLNHSRRSESFILVTIISISLTRKSWDKSAHISFCDNTRDQCGRFLRCTYSEQITVQVFYESANLRLRSKKGSKGRLKI